MFSKKQKNGARPVVYTTETGGIGIDARELFTTEVGREAMRQLIDIEFSTNGHDPDNDRAEHETDHAEHVIEEIS